jgi:hypothetical protein
MLKKVGIPLLTLVAMLLLVPVPKAIAGVRFGVIMCGPAYVAPAPVYPYPAPAPGYYNAYPAYPYSAPGYVYPYNGRRGYGYHGYPEHRGHDWRERGPREHEAWGHGRR